MAGESPVSWLAQFINLYNCLFFFNSLKAFKVEPILFFYLKILSLAICMQVVKYILLKNLQKNVADIIFSCIVDW